MLSNFLLMASVVLLILSGVGVPDAPRFKLQSWGMACLAGAFLAAKYPI